MDISFRKYYDEIYTGDGFRMFYHEWVVEKFFSDIDLDEKVKRRIQKCIYRSTQAYRRTSAPMMEVYIRHMIKSVKMPEGKFKGCLISSLPDKEEVLNELLTIQRENQDKDEMFQKAIKRKLYSYKRM